MFVIAIYNRGEQFGVLTQRQDESFAVSRQLGSAVEFENEKDAKHTMNAFLRDNSGADWLDFVVEAKS